MSDTIRTILAGLVERTECKPGWVFQLGRDADGFPELIIIVHGPDSRGGDLTGVANHFPVPHASYNERAWTRWIFECCRKVENHELGEWFKVSGVRVFPPLHGPGENPYDVRELVTDEEARTNQRGDIEPVPRHGTSRWPDGSLVADSPVHVHAYDKAGRCECGDRQQ